jgi:antitoxin (DNA-binding transcriptional repressor) of toxin-antitoxin stability system
MQAGDEAFDRLRDAIEDLARSEAPGLVAEARAEARAKARSILADALAQALLDNAESELIPAAADAPAPATVAREPDPAPAPPPSPPVPSGETGWYVYCVVGADDLDLAGVAGVDAGHPVTVLRSGELGAVASVVPLDEFGDERLREQLNDLVWLEEKARAHERALEHVRTLTTVVPMRLCTIYLTEGSVREMLERERAALGEALGRLAAKTEWGVKVFSTSEAVERMAVERSPELAALAAEVEQASEGEAYMLRKRLDDLRSGQVDQLVEEFTHSIHARVSTVAVDAVVNPLQAREVTNHSGDMILNGVYLVEDSAAEDFRALVATLQAEHGDLGFDVQATGPWPPYNFVKGSIGAAR